MSGAASIPVEVLYPPIGSNQKDALTSGSTDSIVLPIYSPEIHQEMDSSSDDNDDDDDDDDDNSLGMEAYEDFEPKTMYLFYQTTPPRHWCLAAVTWPYPFRF